LQHAQEMAKSTPSLSHRQGPNDAAGDEQLQLDSR
jgi:hypothetical protein